MALLARNWWAVALRGLSALLLGLLIFVWPNRTLLALVLLFCVYTLVDGILAIVSVVKAGRGQPRRWLMLLEGAVDIVAGILTFIIPDVSTQLILVLLALWAITTGVTEIGSAIRLRREIIGEWLMGLGGITSVLFGLLLLVSVGASPVVVVALIGAYALIFGGLLLALAFRLKWAGAPAVSGSAGSL